MEAGTTIDDGVRSGAQPAAEGESPRSTTTYVALIREDLGGDGVTWVELARVQGRTRAAALEALEERCPVIREKRQPQVQLVPERFWQEIVGEQEQPPPKMVWKGV